MDCVNDSEVRSLQFVHGYLIVNIYTLMVNSHEHALTVARDKRDELNEKYQPPAYYPKDAKAPYVLVTVRSGQVVK